MSSLLIIIIFARLLGFLSKLIGQPKVVGEMLAGIIIGSVFFGNLFPDLQNIIYESKEAGNLDLLSQLGISLYMFLIGINMGQEHINLREMKNALQLALVSIIPTFIVLFLFTWNIYTYLNISISSQLVYSLFMSVSISVTAFPVLIRILEQYNMLNTNLGKRLILGASIDDVIAWILLPFIVAIANFNFSLTDVNIVIYTVAYLLLMFLIIKPIFKLLVERELIGNDRIFFLAILIFLGSTLLTDKIGLHCIFGGIIAGLIVPKRNGIVQSLNLKISDFVNTLLIPIFFVLSGINVDFNNLGKEYSILIVVLFVLLAFGTKYISCVLYSKIVGFNWSEANVIGAMMNVRGLMILIFAKIGVDSRFISNNEYNILFLIAIVTTILVSPLFKLSTYFKLRKYANVWESEIAEKL
ncbi:cation:proton antiporter [Bacillus thuringiensis]|uniref:cation:proton antiporter n=1 Tax=Bacillus thuringiensis TaxID=1428 RepID=UPI00159BE2F8|nr:cation:proton antiporter [Bacillus thuringiensis]